ncbi:hypothetical protein CPC08DRAFT_765709 [Agrocybe pediades]|nr:hypothetical protein CPC08DRAFT_765709 [Agrocybe pediades]
MADVHSTVTLGSDDLSRPSAVLDSSNVQIPTIETPTSVLAVDQPDGPSLASTLVLPETSAQQPITPMATPLRSFSLSDLLEEGATLESLGPHIASADISIALDGQSIDISDGQAAHEMKKLYDQLAGVGPKLISPYALTSFVSQHGKVLYRLGLRDVHTAPGARAADADLMVKSKSVLEPSHSPQGKRSSRLSKHFTPPTIFTKGNILQPPRPTASSTSSHPNRLRKTRSISELNHEPIISSGPTFSVPGRGHSQSVNSMDTPRVVRTDRTRTLIAHSPTRNIDAFGELMNWFMANSNTSSNFAHQNLFKPGKVSAQHDRPRAIVDLPFGRNVSFTPPAYRPLMPKLCPPRHLREMHSFESNLTVTGRPHGTPEESSNGESSSPGQATPNSRPASAIRLSSLSSSTFLESSSSGESAAQDVVEEAPQASEADVGPSAEIQRLSSHYSTEVFNVLQTYRGLPLFETLVPELENATVIKLSLEDDNDATPRDDPRFVIWGEVSSEDADDLSASRNSMTDLSSSHHSSSSASKRRSSRASKGKSAETLVDPPAESRKVILAATIERWIAQLTSALNYDELLNFFLTYRTYVSGVDLCHLLICRFHWALQPASTKRDQQIRRVVRVRTFVAIRYWLLTFFTVDFIPNRELRLLIADWLNSLLHDPSIKAAPDTFDIVRRLIKVAKECKSAHIRTNLDEKPTAPNPAAERAGRLLGKSVEEALRNVSTVYTESDLDLDFLPEDVKLEETETGFSSDPANAHLSAGRAKEGTVLTATRPTSSLPVTSYNILHRTDHAPPPHSDDLPFIPNYRPVPLPNRQSALSRAFVRTIGRLGRWKRALNPKPPLHLTPLSPSDPISAFSLDSSLIDNTPEFANGNSSQNNVPLLPKPIPSSVNMPPPKIRPPLSPINAQPPLPSESDSSHSPATPVDRLSAEPSVSAASSDHLTDVSSIRSQSLSVSGGGSSATESTVAVDGVPPAPSISFDDLPANELPVTGLQVERQPSRPSSRGTFFDNNDSLHGADRPSSFLSSSTDSFGDVLTSDGPVQRTFPGEHSQWGFDVVSIDELASDTASIVEPPHPPGLRKPQKKLPTRHDFGYIRHSQVSSMGFSSHESMRNSLDGGADAGSSPSSSGIPGPITGWQMKSLRRAFASDNDGEEGDVEAALRKLEGQINPKVMQEKAEKVDGWVRSLRERMANGDYYDYESSIFSEDEVEGFIDELDPPTDDTDLDTPPELAVSTSEATPDENYKEDFDGMPHTPVPPHAVQHFGFPPELGRNPRGAEAQKPPPEDVVPLEILQSRLGPSESLLLDNMHFQDSSFILSQSARAFAEHFAMIDRELFISVKFEELVSDDWLECKEINVLDWAQYLKDRAQWKEEGIHPEKTTALAAVRARFNLMVAFVATEIIMTHPSDRHMVAGKFIRVAWSCYTISNFNTMTAIIAGLQSELVERCMRRSWHRLTLFEKRVLHDLKQFISPENDFKIMRMVVDSIIAAKPLDGASHSASVSGGDSQSGKNKASSDHSLPLVPTSCIPFIGSYLSQLHRINKLPALIDPTAPNSVIGIDSETAIFDPPAHPEVFSSLAPLPPSMHLEPLINVHKQRCIAEVIKSLVAGQHYASRMKFEVDKKFFTRCLRLRGFSTPLLRHIMEMSSR